MAKLSVVYSDAREFLYIADSISVVVEEAALSLRPEGATLRALDPSRTAMVDLFMPREAFDEYPDIDGEIRVGMNFKELKKILRRVRKGDKVAMEVDEGKLKVKLLGRAVRSVTLPIIETVAEELPTPRVVFTALIRTASDVMAQALKDADTISDTVKFDALDDALYIRASSDKGEVEVKLDREGEAVYEYDVREPASSMFSTEYLVDIATKASKISDIATIELATAKPISITFEIPAGGKLTYFVAPRVE